MPTEEDRERLCEAWPGAISQEMRGAQIRLIEHLKSLGEAPPSVAISSDLSGFVVTVSREWVGVRFTPWEEWSVEWVHV